MTLLWFQEIMNETREKLLFGDRNEKLDNALKIFGKTRTEMEQDKKIIKEWLITQEHFPEIPRTY